MAAGGSCSRQKIRAQSLSASHISAYWNQLQGLQAVGWVGGVCWPGEQMVGWEESLLAGRHSPRRSVAFFFSFFYNRPPLAQTRHTHTHTQTVWMSKAKSVNLKGHREASLHVFLKYHRTFLQREHFMIRPRHSWTQILSLLMCVALMQTHSGYNPSWNLLLEPQRQTSLNAGPFFFFYQKLNTHHYTVLLAVHSCSSPRCAKL